MPKHWVSQCFGSNLSTEDKEAIAQEDEAIMTAITAARHFPEQQYRHLDRTSIHLDFRRNSRIHGAQKMNTGLFVYWLIGTVAGIFGLYAAYKSHGH